MEKQPVNILMVDDQPQKLLSYETVLGSLGENLVRANSGQEALEYLLRHDTAVVLIDVCMPEIDGFELAAMIRTHPRYRKTAVILVSGVLVGDTDRLRGYDSGAVDYVSVPIIPEILRAKVAVFAELFRKSVALERLNQELEQRVEERTREIESARREAEHANRLKDDFLATLSHELRTPLNAITGWAHLLLSGALSAAEQHTAIETISRNAQVQAQLISDLLDISRIISGKLRLELGSASLPEIISGAVTTMRPAFEAKQLSVDFQAGADLEAIHADPARLQQVAWNLLSNAAKFSPRGGRIAVTLQREGDRLELSVTDDGPGIPPAFLPFIFERFRQGDPSSTRSNRGLGLGLAIVRHLVEAHGGTIAARNRTDHSGAVFQVSIPIGAQPPVVAAAAPEPGADALHQVRVLVVDDDADGREVAARILEAAGAEVLVAANAAEAFTILQRERPAILVADIEMPGENGYSLVQRVKALAAERGGGARAIALTAYAGAQDHDRLLAAGFERHVPKPVHAPALVAAVASLARPRTFAPTPLTPAL